MAVDTMGSAVRGKKSKDAVSNGSRVLPNVDSKSVVARRYQHIAAAIISDLGGLSELSESKVQLCRRFAAASVLSEQMEARMARGEGIDLGEHALLVSSLVRLSGRLGIDRVAADITPAAYQFTTSYHHGHIDENGETVIDGPAEDPNVKPA